MARRISGTLLLLAALLAAGCLPSAEQRRVEQLWGRMVTPYLAQPLWQPGDSYDAANVLMLPLHHAFSASGSRSQRREFDDFFARFEQEAPILFDDNTLRTGQFSYLISRYLVLSAQMGRWGAVQERLRHRLLAFVEFQWLWRIRYDVTFTQRFAGHSQRMRWKLEAPQHAPEHAAALVDDEWFVMAIAADLSRLNELLPALKQTMLARVMEESCQAVREAGHFTAEGGWLLQPGVWWDHPDYAYAGHAQLAAGLTEAPRQGIEQDSSHAHRLPLWLISLEAGAQSDSCRVLYRDARQGFARQLKTHVWHDASGDFPAPRLSNYLDGSNGVYRYGYATLGEQGGYGPHELSGVLLTGWYGFLGTNWIRSAYGQLAQSFPLPEQVVRVYTGPATSRARQAQVALPDYWNNGFAELQARLAAALDLEPLQPTAGASQR